MVNDGFAIGYDSVREQAAWVAYRLRPIGPYRSMPRPSFISDPRLPRRDPTPVYTGPDYDRGHLAPNYAMSQVYGTRAQRQSFYYTNVAPQRPRLNQLVWQRFEEIEIDDIARDESPLWVMLGPIAADSSSVPQAFFRIWLARTASGEWEAAAFVVPQSVRGDEPLSRFVVSIDRIEALTGLDFLPRLDMTRQAALESEPAPARRFRLATLACEPARYAPRWQGRDGIRLDFERCEEQQKTRRGDADE
ncbi:DNA/RNA non-specific endonuclease [Salinisphaera dokdonensis CL-ES53]|uniref:DNA/RNA non-specific endonuclease n=1 Tax=Salinisphaera dokdonensis CL-ES53 TaxID=1304272 RepID=A0ABV2AVS0_9GAMM